MDPRRIREIIEILKKIRQTGGKTSDMHMKLYMRSDRQGDISVYLFHDQTDQHTAKSHLGHTLADLLLDFGHVSHSLWLENTEV
jgi:hypothetical protein